MFDAALESDGEPNSQFVMLRIVRDVSAEHGDYAAAERAIEEIDKRFSVDVIAMRSAAVVQAFSARTTPAQRRQIAHDALRVAADAHRADRYRESTIVLGAVIRAAGRLRDSSLSVEARKLRSTGEALAKQYKKVRRSFEILKTDPDDATANTIVGKYLCFVKRDWDRGLPHLLASNDDVLAGLAAEKGGPVDVADAWWRYALRQKGVIRSSIKLRAIARYQEALPGLSGLQKVTVTKRISEVTRLKSTEQWISKNARYIVSSVHYIFKPKPSLLSYEKSVGDFAFHTKLDGLNPYIIIDLGQVKTVTKIYIENRGGRADRRAAALTVWLANGTRFGKPVWRAPETRGEWTISLTPTKARFIRMGLTAREAFHLRHVKIFGSEQ